MRDALLKIGFEPSLFLSLFSPDNFYIEDSDSEYIEWEDYVATEGSTENWENFTFTMNEDVELKDIGYLSWYKHNRLKNPRRGSPSWEDNVADYSVLLFWKRFWRYLINSIKDENKFLKECNFLPKNVDLDKYDV